MGRDGPLDIVPLWGVFLGTAILILIADECGYRLGRYRHRRKRVEKDAPVGEAVAAMLGLVAFLLAFTFGLAASRFDNRRAVVMEEANAIGTAWLRAGILPEFHREPVRRLLREYVDARLKAVESGDVEEGVRRSEELHKELWAHAEAAGREVPESTMAALFVESLNQVIDLHAKRLTLGLRSRIPGAIWLALYTVMVLALAVMGYHEGLSGTSRSLAILAIAVALSAVMWLIADLDRPTGGMLKVSQQAMQELRSSMEEGKR